MPHLDDGQLNALLDGELDPAATQAARSHLAACAECAGRLEEARRFLARATDLLGALDLGGAAPQAVAPVSAAAAPLRSPVPPRRVSRTAKEVALDLDAATQKSPALPGEPGEGGGGWGAEAERGGGVFARRPPPRARGMDISTLAWAATIVLAIGVGFLANEVRHARQGVVLTPPTSATPAPAAQGTGAEGAGAAEGAPTAAAGGKGSGATRAPRAATGAPRQAGPAGGATRAPALKQLARGATTQPSHAGAAAARAERRELAAAEPVAQRPVTATQDVSARAAAAPAGNVAGVEAARGGFAQAPGPEPLTSFRRITLEEAVSRLRGSIRLVDGMQIDRVEAGPGYLASGAARNRDLVRILYLDAEGRRLQLDEQRLDLVPDSAGIGLREEDALVGLRPGDTLTTAAPGGQVRVRWLDRSGFWLSLTAALSPDSLRSLVSRVR